MTPTDPDPIDTSDVEELRTETLRLRDLSLGLVSRAEVLTDRVSELETALRHSEQAHRNLNQAHDDLNQAHHELERYSEAEIKEHQRIIAELQQANQALHTELRRHPIIRIGRAIARRFRLI